MLNALSPLPPNINLFFPYSALSIILSLFSPFLSVHSFQPYATLLLYSHICMILFLMSFYLFYPQPRKKRLFFHFHPLNTYLQHCWPFLYLSAQQLRCIIEEDGYVCYRIMLAVYIIRDKAFIIHGQKSNGKHLSESETRLLRKILIFPQWANAKDSTAVRYCYCTNGCPLLQVTLSWLLSWWQLSPQSNFPPSSN